MLVNETERYVFKEFMATDALDITNSKTSPDFHHLSLEFKKYDIHLDSKTKTTLKILERNSDETIFEQKFENEARRIRLSEDETFLWILEST